MKKRILLFTATAGIAIITLTSGQFGAGAESGFDCTGAETASGNGAGCSHGSCHSTSATAGINVTLELDSAGSAITHYTPGVTYTVKITGTNTTASTLPKFGFQVTCIKGAVAAASPSNAGTWGTVSGSLQNTPSSAYFVCNLVEHRSPISATTLGGATGGTYVESFQWTAPAAGTGIISFWGAVNAVNGNGDADAGDLWNTTHLILADTIPVSHVSVANVTSNISLLAYPNPVSNNLNLQINNAQAGTYSIQVFDLSGRCISNENIALTGTSQTTNINTGNWAAGLYQVVIQKDDNRQIVRVVKNL